MTTMAATNVVPPTTTCSCSVSGRWDDPQTINRSASRRAAAAARPFGSNSGVAFKQWSIISTSCAETAPAQAQRGLEHLSLGYGGYQRRREAGRVRARARARARAVAGQELSDGFQTTHFSKPGLQSRIIWAKAAGTNSTLFRLHKGFKLDFSSVEVEHENQHEQTNGTMASLSALVGVSTFIFYSGPAYARENGAPLNPAYGEVGVILELGVQLLYLGALLTLLGVGSFLVVRQVLIKRELESAAKELQDRVRSGEASSLEYFELGAVMLRKKFYQVARKHLNDAIKKWDGSEQDLAQVYNALGFSYFSEGKIELAISQYEKSVNLQPMYVTAWNNLADAYETQKNYPKALKAYEEALQFDPSNKVATAKREQMKQRVERFQGIPKK